MSGELSPDDILAEITGRRGHFRLESGYHGDLWLDLEGLCLQPRRVQPLTTRLAERLSGHGAEVVCGPLVEGAFVGLLVAAQLGVQFTYTQRVSPAEHEGLFSVQYLVPGVLRERMRGRRVAIVNDVISAGSAVRGTYADLRRCGARVVAIGALLVLGTEIVTFASDEDVALETLATEEPYSLWTPEECPLCAQEIPLEIPEDR